MNIRHVYEDDSELWSVRYWLHENGLSVYFELVGDDGEVEIDGSVKWDGCMNWRTSEACMYHFCNPQHAVDLAHRFSKVWELGLSIMPKAAECYQRIDLTK